MFAKSTLNSNRGFSLIQVLMAVGLTALMSLALAQVLLNMTTTQKRARIENEMMDRMEDMRRALVRSDACLLSLNSSGENLRTKAPTAIPIVLQHLVDENNKILFKTGETIANGNLTVFSITGELNKTTPVWKPNSLIILDMMVKADIVGIRFGGSRFQKRFSLTVETGPVGEVASCNSLDYSEKITLENAICDAFGGNIPPGHQLCDLRTSTTVIRAACESMGLKAQGDHCE